MNQAALHDAIRYIDDWLDYQFPLTQAPSLSIAVSYNEEIVFTKALGEANQETHRPATSDTIYRFASHSKMFTAVALLQLQEAGLVDINKPAADYLPWLKEHSDDRWHSVTVGQLLSHSAGVARDGSRAGFWTLQRPFPGDDELRQDILRQNLVIEPASKMKYSNYGFGVLGMVIAAVSGSTYNDYIEKNIIKKIGLTHTTTEVNDGDIGMIARGYTTLQAIGKQLPIDHCNTHALAAATGFCSTPSDMCRFVDALYDDKLITAASRKQMQQHWQPAKYSGDLTKYYGLGLEIGAIGGHEIHGHGGSFPGTRSSTRHDHECGITVSAANNDTSITSALVVKSIFNIIHWFSRHYAENPAHDLGRFTGRFGTLWGVSEILGYSDAVIEFFPQLPLNLDDASQLTRIDDTTLELTEASSYDNLGEHSRYTFEKNGKITSIKQSGATVLPLKEFQERLSKIDRISLDAPHQK